MHKRFLIFTVAAVALVTASLPASAVTPKLAPSSTVSDDDAKAIEPAVAELMKRVEANDVAFVGKLIEGSDASTAADMIARIRRGDVRKTWRARLSVRDKGVANLNYHEPSHFQVELKQGAEGKWGVARLYFCR